MAALTGRLRVIGDSKLKNGTSRGVRLCREAASVRLDDRATYRQAHPQATSLGRIKRIEKALESLRKQARTGIRHSDHDALRCVRHRIYPQIARSLTGCAHCLDGVDNQVEHDLLH